MRAGAYCRTTGILLDSRDTRDSNGNIMLSSAYMEEQYLLLIAEQLPESVVVGAVEKEVDGVTVNVDTVNGAEYTAYMMIGGGNG